MSDTKSFLDQRVIDLVNTYIKSNANPETKVAHHLPPEKLRSQIDLTLPENGCSLDELYKTIEQYLTFSVRTGHRQFFNQLWSGFTLPGLLGELFASLANTSMYTYEVAPVATIIETEMINLMNSYSGYSDGDGIFVTGGSNANLIAMF